MRGVLTSINVYSLAFPQTFGGILLEGEGGLPSRDRKSVVHGSRTGVTDRWL